MYIIEASLPFVLKLVDQNNKQKEMASLTVVLRTNLENGPFQLPFCLPYANSAELNVKSQHTLSGCIAYTEYVIASLHD